MIAMLVLLVGMLGSLVGVIAAADHNLGNALRDEAVKIAQEELENARAKRYALIVDNNDTVQRQVRKTLYSFEVKREVTPDEPTNSSLKVVRVTVQWRFKDPPPQPPHGTILETIIRQRS